MLKKNIIFKSNFNDKQRVEIAKQVAELASLLHDKWRASRKKEDGVFEPQIETTKDQTWIETHGTDQVDITNTNYADLPKDWQGENKASAEVAINEVWIAKTENKSLNEAFIEQVSHIIHQQWLERNGSWAPVEQNKPYSELSDEEKDKDRAIVRKAIELVNQDNQ